MADQKNIDLCRNCVSRSFVTGRGLVCKRSGNVPEFEGECENFEVDGELEKMAPPPDPEVWDKVMSREQLLAEENLPVAVVSGLIASLVGAAVWSAVSVATGYQIGYMAIGMGFLVGFAMRLGKGIRPVFGVIGAALALLGCILGDFFSIIGFVAKEYDVSYMETLRNIDYKEVISAMEQNLISMTILFYGMALYEGYKLSFRKQKQPESGKI